MSDSFPCQNSSAIQVLTSVDLISSIVDNLIPPDSQITQAWLSSLALIHTSWSQSVCLALRQHPIISSTAQFLSFQDSLRNQFDHLAIKGQHKLDYERDQKLEIDLRTLARTNVPSACAVRSMIINLYNTNVYSNGLLQMVLHETLRRQLQLSKELYLDPGFFSSLSQLHSIHLSRVKISIKNLTFLLSTLSRSLVELGLHDVYFVGSATAALVFDSIFNLLDLKSLSFTGSLSTSFCMMTLLQKTPENSHKKQRLETLCLSDAGCKPASTILTPRHLMFCWESNLGTNPDKMERVEDSIGYDHFNPNYPNPLKIKNYRMCTSAREWHLPTVMKDLRENADPLGIRIEVAHPCDTLQRIQWMSQHI